MFWGLIMEPQKRYSQIVKKSFHVSMAALDIGSSYNEPTQVICSFEDRNYLLCTLKSQNILQAPLDLNFEVGDKVSFATNGKSHVHLTGYLVEADSDESSSFEEETNVPKTLSRKRVPLENDTSPPKKKSKVLELLEAIKPEDEDDSDDSDFDISDMEEGGTIAMGEEEEDVDEGDDHEDDDSDENEEEVEESDNVEEEEEDDSSEGGSDDEEEVSPKENGIQLKNQAKKQREAVKVKKQKETLETGKGKTPAKSPTKGDKTPAKPDKTPTKGNKTPKGDKSPSFGKEGATVPKRTVEGGVIIEDIKLGNGPIAKNGKLVQVYYEGRLKNNNKMFDSTMKGPGFRFRLGKQEVIRGWDVGVLGMKVGGKRRIVCPPNMAYGQKGSPPVIPPNSTLVFDVELKNLN